AVRLHPGTLARHVRVKRSIRTASYGSTRDADRCRRTRDRAADDVGRPVTVRERREHPSIDVRDADDAAMDEADAEVVSRNDRPGPPRIVVPASADVDVDREDRAVVPAERAPAHVSRSVGP